MAVGPQYHVIVFVGHRRPGMFSVELVERDNWFVLPACDSIDTPDEIAEFRLLSRTRDLAGNSGVQRGPSAVDTPAVGDRPLG